MHGTMNVKDFTVTETLNTHPLQPVTSVKMLQSQLHSYIQQAVQFTKQSSWNLLYDDTYWGLPSHSDG